MWSIATGCNDHMNVIRSWIGDVKVPTTNMAMLLNGCFDNGPMGFIKVEFRLSHRLAGCSLEFGVRLLYLAIMLAIPTSFITGKPRALGRPGQKVCNGYVGVELGAGHGGMFVLACLRCGIFTRLRFGLVMRKRCTRLRFGLVLGEVLSGSDNQQFRAAGASI